MGFVCSMPNAETIHQSSASIFIDDCLDLTVDGASPELTERTIQSSTLFSKVSMYFSSLQMKLMKAFQMEFYACLVDSLIPSAFRISNVLGGGPH